MPAEAADSARAAAADAAARGKVAPTHRPALGDRLVLRVASPFVPGTHYVITVHGIRNVNGVAADASGALTIPPRPPPVPAADSAARDSLGRAAPRPGCRARPPK